MHKFSLKRIKSVGIVLFVALALSYTTYQLRGILHGPKIEISYPTNGALLYDDHITFKGASTDIASLFLNGHQIFTDQAGNFSEGMLLLRGYNVLEVQAVDKFNRVTTKHIEVVLDDSTKKAAQANAVSLQYAN